VPAAGRCGAGGGGGGGGPLVAQLEADVRDADVARCVLLLRPAAVVVGLRLATLWDFTPAGLQRAVDAELAATLRLAERLLAAPRETSVVLQSNTALHLHRRWTAHMGISGPRARALAARLAGALPAFPPRVAYVDAYNASLARADLAADGIHFGAAYSLNAIETVLSLACRTTTHTPPD
jgi:hypothetical protein